MTAQRLLLLACAALFASSFAHAQDAPLPEPTALLLKVKAHQKRLQELRRDYVCREEETSDELDKDGAVKKHETFEYDMYWRGRYAVTRMVSKNGKPRTAEELKKEDEKIDQRVAKAERKQEKREAEGKDDVEIGIETFLRASLFQNLRREQFRGREVIAMDVLPNPAFEPSTLSEKIVHLLAGRVWIDEQAQQVVRLEAHLDKKLKVGGGLAAAIQEGSGAVLEQQRINDEVWMPALADVTVRGRALLFVGIHQHIVQRYSDYRKFHTEVTISAPEAAPEPAPPQK